MLESRFPKHINHQAFRVVLYYSSNVGGHVGLHSYERRVCQCWISSSLNREFVRQIRVIIPT